MLSKLFFAILALTTVCGNEEFSKSTVAFVIITQPTKWHLDNTRNLKESLRRDVPEAVVFDTVNDFGNINGAWAVWPLFKTLYDRLGGHEATVRWLFICEDGTTIKGDKLLQLLNRYDSSEPVFLGHGLTDSSATIIHHFATVGNDTWKFMYPDFAGGIAVSWSLLGKLVTKMMEGKKLHDFTIDPKHELAMLVWDGGKGWTLTHIPEFCTVSVDESCVTVYEKSDYHRCPPANKETTDNDDVVFAVKTYHEFHKTRVVVVKRTWGLQAMNIEFFSDKEDHYIPTITVGIENTERGHCGKTLAILKHFITNYANKKWLAIADDDTLFSVPRLLLLLNCYDYNEPLIIGERYGYGFGPDGADGYDFPTGGAGMIFSRAAAQQIVNRCICPSSDSPDDMILGICTAGNLPIIHSSALHQARPDDYSNDYLVRIKPISFHKHWNNDPYLDYSYWLAEEKHQRVDETSKSHMHNGEL